MWLELWLERVFCDCFGCNDCFIPDNKVSFRSCALSLKNKTKVQKKGWMSNTTTHRTLCDGCKKQDEVFRSLYSSKKSFITKVPTCEVIFECTGCNTVQFYHRDAPFLTILSIDKIYEELLAPQLVKVCWHSSNPTCKHDVHVTKNICHEIKKHDWCHMCYSVKIVCVLKKKGIHYDIIRVIMKDYLSGVYPVKRSLE